MGNSDARTKLTWRGGATSEMTLNIDQMSTVYSAVISLITIITKMMSVNVIAWT